MTRDVSTAASLPPEDIASAIEQLEGYDMNLEGLANAYRGECKAFADIVDDFQSGKSAKYGVQSPTRALPFFFKPNETRRMYADYLRYAIRNAAARPREKQPPLPDDVQELLDAENSDALRRSMWKGNAIGKVLFAMCGPALERVNLQARREEWEIRATRVFMALRHYHMTTGELPETLDALVPEYLAQVPVDPFDGKPLHYAREERKLYSADQECRESGQGEIEIPFH